MNAPDNAQRQDTVEPEEIRGALAEVLASGEFSGADRLKEFLSYVVEEQLAGRGNNLRAKTIAVDVYRRKSGDEDAETLVRVDAGRLRRRLDVYYAGSGAEAPARIHIDRGGYAPRFSKQTLPAPTATSIDQKRQGGEREMWPLERLAIAVLSAAVLLLLGSTVYFWQERGAVPVAASQVEPDVFSNGQRITRQVLFEENPARLQALNLVEHGQAMILPAPDRYRVQAAKALFEQAIRLDPDYSGGYAGLALAGAVGGALMPPGPQRDAVVGAAREAAAEAIRRAPTDPLSLTGQAMAAFADGDDEIARDRIAKAASLAPKDRHIRDYQSLVELFAGDLDLALELSDPRLNSALPYQRLAWRNVHAMASLLSGDPQVAIDLLTEGAALGDPVSIINHAVLAASYQAVGQDRQARAALQRMERAWPESNLAGLLEVLFRDPARKDAILDPLRRAGWTDARPAGEL